MLKPSTIHVQNTESRSIRLPGGTGFWVGLLLIFSLLLCTACGQKDIPMDKEREDYIDASTQTIYEELLESFELAQEDGTLLDSIVAFADENEIYYRLVDDKTVILIKQPNDDVPALDDITLQCSLQQEDPIGSAQRASVLLSAMRNAGNMRRTTSIFSLKDGPRYLGAESLPGSYLDTPQLISIVESKKPTLYSSSASLTAYHFTHPAKMEPAGEAKSFRIEIQIPPTSLPTDPDQDVQNPLLLIDSLLSWCESSHLDYRIGEIAAGEDVDAMPHTAFLTVVLDASDITKFQNKVTKEIEKFTESYGSEEEGYQYHLSATGTPAQVLRSQDATELLGLLYTLQDNFDYLSDDEEAAGTTLHTLTSLSVSADQPSITVGLMSRYPGDVAEGATATLTELAALNDFTVIQETVYPYWRCDPEDPLTWTFKKTAKEVGLSLKETDTYKTLETGIFSTQKSDLHQIAVGVGTDHYQDVARAVILLLERAEEQE